MKKKKKTTRPLPKKRRHRLGDIEEFPELNRTFIHTNVPCEDPGQVLDIADSIAEISPCVFNIYCDIEKKNIVIVAECDTVEQHKRFKKIVRDAEVR